MNIRNLPQRDFTIVRNAAMDDPRLSWKAKGLLTYMRTRPERWQFHVSHLSTVSTDGRDATRAGLQELQDAGYLAKVPRQDPSSGQLVGWEWIVSDDPAAVSTVLRETRSTGSTAHGEPVTNKTEGSKTDTNQDGVTPPTPPKPKSKKFDPTQALPDHVSDDVWAGFVEHRKAIGKPLTERAVALLAAKLARTPSDADAMLEQSIENGWTGVFPLKHDTRRIGNGASPSLSGPQAEDSYEPISYADALKLLEDDRQRNGGRVT